MKPVPQKLSVHRRLTMWNKYAFHKREIAKRFEICWMRAFDAKTTREIAEHFGLTTSRIQQILSRHRIERGSIKHGDMPPEENS